MARIAAEARVDQTEWTLVFKAGWQRRLRVDGFFAGHNSKEELKAGIAEELRRLNAVEEEVTLNGEEVGNLTSRIAKLTPDTAASETGVETNNNSSSVCNGRSTGPRGGPGRGFRTPPVAVAAHRDARENSGELKDWRLSEVGDVVARVLDDFQGSSGASSSSPSPDNNKRRRGEKIVAAESYLPGDGSPEQLWPTLSPKVVVEGLLPAARLLEDTAPAPMDDEGSESAMDDPVIKAEVDNFVLHSNKKLVSVTTLPVNIDGVLTGGVSPPEKVYVVGTVGPDCLTFKKRVAMWRLVLDPTRRPQFLLKTTKGSWVKLVNPQDDYCRIMNDVRVLGYFLSFVRKLPNASTAAAEQDLQKMCSMHSNKPTLDRLSRHIKVIRSFIEEDDEFATAPLLRRIFPNLFPKNHSPRRDEHYSSGDAAGVKRKAGRPPLLKSESTEKKRYKVMAKKSPKSYKASPSPPDLYSESDHTLNASRMAETSERLQQEDGSETEYEQPESDLVSMDVHKRIFTPDELNVEDPPICILCDDGGSLLYCDGPCHRHFHPTKGSGEGSLCETLGLAKAEVKAMGKYYCPNCKHEQQQCFLCGDLGSSVPLAGHPEEVRRCDVPFCKKFFHVECAAEALCASSNRAWTDLAHAISHGKEQLYCPRHCCSVCGEAEMDEPGMLVQCRRCPKAWHRQCLNDFSRSKELDTTLIWRHYDREFIYCRNHVIIPKLQTPARTHLKFPDV